MKAGSHLVPIAKRLEGKVALITGGARGIGEATVRLFARHGAKVVIADVIDELGMSLCKDITRSSPSESTVSFVRCDVTKELDVENAVDIAVKDHGKLDVMFSNAGILGRYENSILTEDYDNFKRVFDTNVCGAFLSAKHAARVTTPAKAGSIVFTASVASLMGGPASHTYAASKHAIVGLTKNLGVELGQHGIRVNCISPYGVATPMSSEGRFSIMAPEKLEEIYSEAGNLKEAVLKAEDVAEAALYLASNESKYVSGMNLVVDGGFSTTNVSLGMSLEKYFKCP